MLHVFACISQELGGVRDSQDDVTETKFIFHTVNEEHWMKEAKHEDHEEHRCGIVRTDSSVKCWVFLDGLHPITI